MSAELRVGDKIAVRGVGFGTGVTVIEKIERETPRLWITKHYRFRNDDLRIVSPGIFGPYSGFIPTDANFLNVRIAKANERLPRIRATGATIDAAEAFIAAHEASLAPDDGNGGPGTPGSR